MSQHSLRRWLVTATTVALAFGILGLFAAPQEGAVTAAPSAEACEWTLADRQSTGHYHVASAYDAANNAIYYFGGVDQSGEASAFLGSLDTSDPDPTKAGLTSVRPSGLPQIYGSAGFFRADAMDADKSAAYFVGGSRNSTMDEGEGDGVVYRYTPKTNTVDQLNAPGNLPDVLHGAVAYDPRATRPCSTAAPASAARSTSPTTASAAAAPPSAPAC